jgi:carbon-monoxide dehydrogenase medium subunit
MRPAAFDYVRAGSVAEALAALADDREARVLAGGQSLVPMMALRLARPEVLVDITRCPELLSSAVDGPVLRIGAAVRDAVLERDPGIRAAHPLLVRTLSLIAHDEIRARATLCGSLAHADPAGHEAGRGTARPPAGHRRRGGGRRSRWAPAGPRGRVLRRAVHRGPR